MDPMLKAYDDSRKGRTSNLVRAAMGEIKADLVNTGVKLINVYSAELLEEREICRRCRAHLLRRHQRQTHCRRSDEDYRSKGFYISPGLIDAHTHIGHYVRPFEHLQSFCRSEQLQ